jgi:hypothetical protein
MEHHAMPLFDNLSSIKLWQGNFLCRTYSGSSFTKRMLYTDSDDVIFKFMRPILITGINVPTEQPDLLDRTLLVNLSRLAEEKRQEDKELWRRFEEARPVLLGGLLNTLADAFARKDSIKLKYIPRFADFARWGAAAAEALGIPSSSFEEALRSNTNRQQEEVRESSVFQAVMKLLSRNPVWEGSAGELLEKLQDADKGLARQPGWPKTPQLLSRRLNELHPAFVDSGVTMSRSASHRTGRIITFQQKVEEPAPSAPPAPSSPPQAQPEVPQKVDNDEDEAAFIAGLCADIGLDQEQPAPPPPTTEEKTPSRKTKAEQATEDANFCQEFVDPDGDE